MSNDRTPKMRLYHRYLGYFLSGIIAVYAISGVTLIFRDTNFLKREKAVERQLQPNLNKEELGREMRIRDLKIEKDEQNILTFRNGSYDRSTGIVKYTTKELPWFIDRLTKLHKADTKDPLFFLNVFFGLSLLFFVVSAFWMFFPGTTVFRKGLYFAAAGIVLTILMLLI